jgi:HD-like signal output (HDOD) protein
MDVSQLRERIASVRDLPAVPDIICRLNEVAKNPKSSTADFARIVSREPAVATKVIRTANSVVFCPPGTTVRTLHQAIVLLGLDTLRGLAMASTLCESFASTHGHRLVDQNLLWTHSLATAIGSRAIATLTHCGDPSEAMTAGLLHDVGFLVMGVLDRRTLDRTLDLARREEVSCPEAEILVGGTTHAQWGMAATQHWGLCDTIVNAAGYHHLPQEENSTRDITNMVHVACALAAAQMISVSSGLRGHPIDEQIRESVGLPDAQLQEIRKLMQSEAVATARAFGLAVAA